MPFYMRGKWASHCSNTCMLSLLSHGPHFCTVPCILEIKTHSCISSLLLCPKEKLFLCCLFLYKCFLPWNGFFSTFDCFGFADSASGGIEDRPWTLALCYTPGLRTIFSYMWIQMYRNGSTFCLLFHMKRLLISCHNTSWYFTVI